MTYSKSLCLILVSALLSGCAGKQVFDTEVEKKAIRGDNGAEIPISAYNALKSVAAMRLIPRCALLPVAILLPL